MSQFDYFYGDEAEQFAFYRIPKLLITSPVFKRLSDGAKLLYGLMLDRMCLSVKNGWVDEHNRAYIFFTTNDVMELMCCGTEKATRIIAELDSEKGIGLIERKKQGQGKPAIVYLKKFYGFDDSTGRKCRLSETESQDFGKSKNKTFDNQNSRVSESKSADFREPKCNNTEISDTEKSYTDLSETNPIISNQGGSSSPSGEISDKIRWIEERNCYEKIIKHNIDYDIIVEQYAMDLMVALYSICGGVVTQIAGSLGGIGAASVTLPSVIESAVEDAGFWASIPLWLVTILGSLFITIMSFIMIMSVYGRFFRLYMYTALAPVPLSSFAGEGTSEMGKHFVKSYVGVCLEGAVIVLACIIFSAFSSTSTPTIDTSITTVTMIWKYIGEVIFNMLVLVGLIKGSDRIIKEMLGT